MSSLLYPVPVKALTKRMRICYWNTNRAVLIIAFFIIYELNLGNLSHLSPTRAWPASGRRDLTLS